MTTQAIPFRLDGKVAVVPGAGRGIGRGAAVALALARAGADIAGIDIAGLASADVDFAPATTDDLAETWRSPTRCRSGSRRPCPPCGPG